MIVLGVDPGKAQGWALVESALVGPPTLLACGLGGPEVWDWNALPRPDQGVVEVPFCYPGDRTPPNDLITLALTAGDAIGYMRYRLMVDPQTVYPSQWKGNLPKPKKAADPYIVANRIKERCKGTERVEALGLAKSLEHNVWDAVGLAMYGCRVSIK